MPVACSIEERRKKAADGNNRRPLFFPARVTTARYTLRRFGVTIDTTNVTTIFNTSAINPMYSG